MACERLPSNLGSMEETQVEQIKDRDTGRHSKIDFPLNAGEDKAFKYQPFIGL